MKPELWNPAMSVGVHDLDQDHKWILETISALYTAIEEGDSQSEIIDLLGDLENYIEQHFPKEVLLMQEYKCPGISDHVLYHEYFQKVMDDFKKKASVGDLNLDKEVHGFLAHWFVNHICNVDRKYASDLKKKGITR